MFSDAMPGVPVEIGKNINVAVVSDDLKKMTAEFNRLGQDGKIQMELQETFWSLGYGKAARGDNASWIISNKNRLSSLCEDSLFS
ncbi:hypothetical protein [Planococcus maitriensis]|uniref:hypothetical protein n=1 Tax=Planococcus maitriensis TaxID=221799 RepID=UPI00197C6040